MARSLKRFPILVVLVASCMLMLNLLQPMSAFAHTSVATDESPITDQDQITSIQTDIGDFLLDAKNVNDFWTKACPPSIVASHMDLKDVCDVIKGIGDQRTLEATNLALALESNQNYQLDKSQAHLVDRDTKIRAVIDSLNQNTMLVQKLKGRVEPFAHSACAIATAAAGVAGLAGSPLVGGVAALGTLVVCEAVVLGFFHSVDVSTDKDEKRAKDLKDILESVGATMA